MELLSSSPHGDHRAKTDFRCRGIHESTFEDDTVACKRLASKRAEEKIQNKHRKFQYVKKEQQTIKKINKLKY